MSASTLEVESQTLESVAYVSTVFAAPNADILAI